MVLPNDHHLVIDVVDRVPALGASVAPLRQRMVDVRLRAREYIREHGEDVPEVSGWTWPHGPGPERPGLRGAAFAGQAPCSSRPVAETAGGSG